ncbi:MAG: methyltransferase domain-containing protein [Myxococcota bacterium]|nr:methyltransferase domain-containing protein [Myxococcota bacterium]
MADNRTYYDSFSDHYDVGRERGYHRFLDEAELSVAASRCAGRDVLEVGCGTGLILERIAPMARTATGVDLSPGMLERARERGLEVHEGNATELPFEDGSFDTVVCFKVIAHVEAVEKALREMARVVRPGGHVVCEFYNTKSLRAWVKNRVKPGSIGKDGVLDEGDVYLRYDTKESILSYLPEELEFVRWDGIRIISPAAVPFNIPVFGWVWEGLERAAMQTPLRNWGGFLVVTLRRT